MSLLDWLRGKSRPAVAKPPRKHRTAGEIAAGQNGHAHEDNPRVTLDTIQTQFQQAQPRLATRKSRPSLSLPPLPDLHPVPLDIPKESEAHQRKTIDLFDSEEQKLGALIARLDESRQKLDETVRIQRVSLSLPAEDEAAK